MIHTRLCMVAIAIMGLTGNVAADGHNACGQCGCCQGRKVCRLVPDVKKTTTYDYRLQCEDICLHGRSRCVGSEQVCNCRGVCRCEPVMKPTCGRMITVAKVVKVPIVTEKCGWKCVVVCTCGGCGQCAAAREATPVETQQAVAEATRQGILTVSAEEPITVTIADDAQVVEPTAEVADDAEALPEAPLPKPRRLFSIFSK